MAEFTKEDFKRSAAWTHNCNKRLGKPELGIFLRMRSKEIERGEHIKKEE